MLKRFGIFFIGVILLVSCGKKSSDMVSWIPEMPKKGDVIQISYKQNDQNANLVDASKLIFICQYFTDEGDSILISPMTNSKNEWQIDLKPPASTYLLSFKFEDDLNRTDDNNGRGWSVAIHNKDNKVVENTHYQLGQIYLGKNRPEAFPYYVKAIAEFNNEIALYPKNYKSWQGLWEANVKLSEKNKSIVRRQLDSLLAVDSNNDELLKVSFFTNWKIFNNIPAALEIADRLSQYHAHEKTFAGIAYATIHLRHTENIQRQMDDLEKFILHYPDSDFSRAAYFRLGNYYLQSKSTYKAKYMFEKLSELYPDDVANKLTLASMEINDKNYTNAKSLLSEASTMCTEELLRKDNPWIHPGRRMNERNFNLCQIYSTTASLNVVIGDYEAAIDNRKAVIELGTPFPAFEWSGIGDAYLKLGKLDQAEKAYIIALSVNPEQNDAQAKLKSIFLMSALSKTINFDEYLEQKIKEELKASAELAPNFELSDIDNNKHRLSDYQGKIVLLYFWDSWSPACIRELPMLNELVKTLNDLDIIEFWAISIEHKNAVNKFLETNEFNYHQFYGGGGVKKAFKIIGFPTHVVIDGNGYIRYKYIGFTPEINQKLKENIQFLLKESNIIS